MHVLRHIILKELLQLGRDKKMIPIIFVAPVVQLLALGYAANLDVTDIPIVLVDQDRSAASRDLVDRFVSSGYFELRATEDAVAAVEPWLVTGRARMALVIAGGYGEAVAAGDTPRVQVLADGSDSSASGIGLGYASGIVAQASAELVVSDLRSRVRRRSGPGSPPSLSLAQVVAVPRVWYNPDLRSRWFYVPAVLAMVLMVLTMVLSSMGVVREKEIGTMEQLIVTPIRPRQLILGKLLPYGLIGIIDIFLVVGITIGWFGIPLRGSLVLLVALTMLLLLNTLGLGLLTSTLVRTQQQAMMMAVFVFMIPQIYLSGLLFPIDNMPQAFQTSTYLIPLRYYAEILRGIFLKGAGLGTLWPQAGALAAFGVTFLLLASLRFRKRLD